MRLFDLTLASAAENLALDEALLEDAEAAGKPRESLRLWESPQAVAVVGRSSCVTEEIATDFCIDQNIPVLRRCSGGASVLIGQGCLMYGLVLSYELRPELHFIEHAHEFVLGRLTAALEPHRLGQIQRQGISDLTWGNRKFSGNSLRCKRTHLLYHGTLLYRFPLHLISACLRSPPRQPEYRAGRGHDSFVANLPLDADLLKRSLIAAWRPDELDGEWPHELTAQLAGDRYSRNDWNYRR